MDRITSPFRLLAGLLIVGVIISSMILALVPLMPSRLARIKLTNHVGSLLGWSIMKASGCPMTIRGRERLSADRPAIYVGNHTSVYDAFTSIWLSPTGTVGVAKKEVLFYPFYGLAWYMSGHLVVDRGNSAKAQASLKSLAKFVRDKGLHIFMWPEGTRARDGRLLRFKKGFAHLAIQTGLPIVPMVTTGGHRAWQKHSLVLRPVPYDIEFLPAIDTSNWKLETIDEHIEEVRGVFIAALPSDQQPEVVEAEVEDSAAA